MRSKQGMEPCQKHIQAQRERQDCILLGLGEEDNAGYMNKGAGRKRVCSGFRS